MFSPLRLTSLTTPPSTYASARMPSHLNSKPQASSGVGVFLTTLASIGSMRSRLGCRPGHENASLLEPEIPMQAACVVLLHDEPRRLGLLARDLGAWFGRFLEIAFGLVLGKLSGHSSKVRPQRLSPSSVAPPGRSLRS